jgi:hypothetical protein
VDAERVCSEKTLGYLTTSLYVSFLIAVGVYQEAQMIRKLKSGEYRLYSRKKSPKTGKRRNLGTFKSRAAAEKHERAVQYFKRA